MALNDDIADALTPYVVDLTRVEAGLRRKVLRILKDLQSDIIRLMEKGDPTAAVRTATQQKRLTALLADVDASIAAAYRDINKTLKGDYVRLGKLSSDRVLKAINNSIGVDIVSASVAPAVLTKLAGDVIIQGAKSADWWSRQAKNLQFNFKTVIQQGMSRNETIYDMMKRVRGTKAAGFTDGIMSTAAGHAESLVRTSVINLNNAATMEMYQANSDIISGIAWLATLDTHTTPICAALDGLAWDLEYNPIGHSQQYPGTTAHWGCRSTQTPIIRGIDDLPARKANKLPESTRASVDGKVPASVNYDAWLKKQSKARQLDILGEKKYSIWKENKLSTRDMVDQYNNPLSVAQLEARYG